MSTHQEMKEKTIMEEYYSFLYDLAIKKNYGHSSQLTSEEKKYCERLLSHTTSKYKSNELPKIILIAILIISSHLLTLNEYINEFVVEFLFLFLLFFWE